MGGRGRGARDRGGRAGSGPRGASRQHSCSLQALLCRCSGDHGSFMRRDAGEAGSLRFPRAVRRTCSRGCPGASLRLVKLTPSTPTAHQSPVRRPGLIPGQAGAASGEACRRVPQFESERGVLRTSARWLRSLTGLTYRDARLQGRLSSATAERQLGAAGLARSGRRGHHPDVSRVLARESVKILLSVGTRGSQCIRTDRLRYQKCADIPSRACFAELDAQSSLYAHTPS